ncbi:bile acid:sodium symporter family protein [Sphingobium aromaticiconvertens]|uniref:bile acid:sodium symporter family protein n=1 Tax=Sphingobium aromaticiconvertens TaxID=365341 RepID=UPI003018C510
MNRIRQFLDPFLMILIATVLLASFLPARGQWASVATIAADAGIVLLFFLHGAKLSRQAIWDGARAWKLHLATLGMTFLLFPLIGWGVAAVPTIPPMVGAGLLFLTLLPSTVQSSIAFTAIARGNVAAAVVSASFSNLLGIFLTPLLVTLLMHTTAPGGGLSMSAVEGIFLQLLLPFVAGHLLRPLIGGFIGRHKGLLAKVDRTSILLVVYTAFSAAVVEGLWQRMSWDELLLIAGLCVAMLTAVLIFSWALGRTLGFSREDRIVLQFCGSKKSLASGVPMAGVLFPAAMVGPIILPLMLFHQIQLMACALLARHYAAQAERDAISDSGIVPAIASPPAR